MGRDGTVLDPTVVRGLLQKLRPAASDVVLIGGQALNFWAERYGNAPELAGAAPYTSTDIDFYGQREHVTRCAQLLGGESTLYGPRDRSICSGIVTTADGVQIDFVTTPRGVPASEVPRKAITFAHGRVMHPIHVLMSRAANVSHSAHGCTRLETAPRFRLHRSRIHPARARPGGKRQRRAAADRRGLQRHDLS